MKLSTGGDYIFPGEIIVIFTPLRILSTYHSPTCILVSYRFLLITSVVLKANPIKKRVNDMLNSLYELKNCFLAKVTHSNSTGVIQRTYDRLGISLV